MTTFQKTVQYLAIAFAIFLTVTILGGIVSMAGLFGGFFDGDATYDQMKTYSVSSGIRSLEIEINAADFAIRQGEGFSVESNLKHLTVEEKNGVLRLKEAKKFGTTYTGAALTLYVPEETEFERVNLITGAGRLTAQRLAAKRIKLALGAGEVAIDTLIATSELELNGGAGKITVSGGELHDPELEMGVGQLNLTAKLSGECTFDLGVGESNVTVLGKRESFTLDIEKGIGEVRLDGKSISNFKEKGGKDSIEINGGIGAIRLDFKESGTAFE